MKNPEEYKIHSETTGKTWTINLIQCPEDLASFGILIGRDILLAKKKYMKSMGWTRHDEYRDLIKLLK